MLYLSRCILGRERGHKLDVFSLPERERSFFSYYEKKLCVFRVRDAFSLNRRRRSRKKKQIQKQQHTESGNTVRRNLTHLLRKKILYNYTRVTLKSALARQTENSPKNSQPKHPAVDIDLISRAERGRGLRAEYFVLSSRKKAFRARARGIF